MSKAKKSEPIMSTSILDSDGHPKITVSAGYRTILKYYRGAVVVSASIDDYKQVAHLGDFFKRAADRMRRERGKFR